MTGQTRRLMVAAQGAPTGTSATAQQKSQHHHDDADQHEQLHRAEAKRGGHATGLQSGIDLSAPLAAEQGAVLAEHVRFISKTISASYPSDLDPEAHAWRRVMKVAEEVGEVTQALLGYLGENPRKGRTHTLDDLRTELLDVALAALGAVSHIGADDNDTVALLNSRAEFVHFRLSRAVAMSTPPAKTTGDDRD